MLDPRLRRIIRTVEKTFHVKHRDFCGILDTDTFTITFESPEVKIFVEVNYNLGVVGIDFRQSDIRSDCFESYYL